MERLRQRESDGEDEIINNGRWLKLLVLGALVCVGTGAAFNFGHVSTSTLRGSADGAITKIEEGNTGARAIRRRAPAHPTPPPTISGCNPEGQNCFHNTHCCKPTMCSDDYWVSQPEGHWVKRCERAGTHRRRAPPTRTPTPPPTLPPTSPPLMFHCDGTAGNCVLDKTGWQTAEQCQSSCKKTPTPQPTTPPPTPPTQDNTPPPTPPLSPTPPPPPPTACPDECAYNEHDECHGCVFSNNLCYTDITDVRNCCQWDTNFWCGDGCKTCKR